MFYVRDFAVHGNGSVYDAGPESGTDGLHTETDSEYGDSV